MCTKVSSLSRKAIRMKKAEKFLAVFVAAFISFSLVACGPSAQHLKEQAKQQDKAVLLARMEALKKAETAEIERYKAKAAENLKDPASAQFRALKLIPGNDALCGQINAKNSFGGYVGFRAFSVTSAGTVYFSPSDDVTRIQICNERHTGM